MRDRIKNKHFCLQKYKYNEGYGDRKRIFFKKKTRLAMAYVKCDLEWESKEVLEKWCQGRATHERNMKLNS